MQDDLRELQALYSREPPQLCDIDKDDIQVPLITKKTHGIDDAESTPAKHARTRLSNTGKEQSLQDAKGCKQDHAYRYPMQENWVLVPTVSS